MLSEVQIGAVHVEDRRFEPAAPGRTPTGAQSQVQGKPGCSGSFLYTRHKTEKQIQPRFGYEGLTFP